MNVQDFYDWKQALADGDEKRATRLRNKMVTENLKFVRQQVMRLLARTGVPGEPEDLIQGASLGLVKALEGWDPKKGAFTTYAAWWIRARFQETLATQPQIYRPKHSGMDPKVRRKAEAILARTGRRATAEELGVKQRVLDDADELPLMLSLQGPGARSDDGDTGEGSFSREHGFTVDQENAEDVMVQEDFLDALRRALDWLEPRPKEVIEALYFREEKVKDLAARLGISDEQVRSIKDRALADLREELEP